jgi:hypothetical protein
VGTSQGSSASGAPAGSQGRTAMLLASGPLAIVVFLPFAIAAAIRTPGYDYMASTFSDLAAQGAPHPEIVATGFLLAGLCLALFAVGIGRVFPQRGRALQVAILAIAAGLWGTALFQDHPRGQDGRNLEGVIHNAFATFTTVAILATIVIALPVVWKRPGWSHLVLPGALICLLVAGSIIVLEAGPEEHDGIAERTLLFASLIWSSLLALTGLAALSPRRARQSLSLRRFR